MKIYPAIDLKSGQCVRLTKGDFATAKIYESDPLKQAAAFKAAGSAWVHMVDLDGAKAGTMQQADIITRVAQQSGLRVQAGGGIRDAATIKSLLDHGVERVVVGSLAVKDTPLVQDWLREFGAQYILLAFDVRVNEHGTPEVATHGWQSGSGISLWDVLARYADCKIENVMCTDIALDGVLAGTNIVLYEQLCQRYPQLKILASGGVGTMDDLVVLTQTGVDGVIVGKAIYEGRIDLAEALVRVSHAG